jgi:hypothetical protein
MNSFHNDKSRNVPFYLNNNNNINNTKQVFVKENSYASNCLAQCDLATTNAIMMMQPPLPQQQQQIKPSYAFKQPKLLKQPVAQVLTTKVYVQRLATLQAFSTCLVILSVGFQAVAVATNDWFVLNLNEYIPTSKGGLFNYCYITSSGNPGFYGHYIGQFNCMKYESLPNYAIFVNSLLYDSRILLLCACGFGGLILILELFGCFCLCCVEARRDKYDLFLTGNNTGSRKTGMNSSSIRNNNAMEIGGHSSNGLTDSAARFTNSVVLNNNNNNHNSNNSTPDSQASLLLQRLKPIGYFTYLTCAAIGLVGAFMEFALKLSGFVLFNVYLTRLLELNTIFLAYRSYSFWFMVASIAIGAGYWLFKIISLNYVQKLTRELIAQRERLAPLYFNSTNTIRTTDAAVAYDQANRGNFVF